LFNLAIGFFKLHKHQAMKRFILLFIFSVAFLQVLPQESTSQSDTLRKDALNVYMQASDYIRKEIPFVNYVRDIKDAGVYVISTSQRTGSGGIEYSYFLVGQHQYAGMSDTLTIVTSPDETSDMIREKQVNTLKMGLMRYVAKTPISKYMRIGFSEPLSETVSSDKWNSWVFRSSLNGYLNGQKTYKSNYFSGTFSASRITEEWKINLYARYYKNSSKFIIDDVATIKSSNDSKYISALIVKSLSDHWSIGGSTRAGSSSYDNERSQLSFMPGIEYDVFPYSESTRRQLRILYSAGYNYLNYIDSTIYDKTKEHLWLHSLSASYEVVQKWGSVDIIMEYRNYFHDWSKNNLTLYGYLNLRIVKGLSVNFGASASLIHDQLGLVKQGLTTEEILLQRKELATQYQYYTSLGFSYTFGSIYNNVVNPRFGQ
jgi:hypothetical protein